MRIEYLIVIFIIFLVVLAVVILISQNIIPNLSAGLNNILGILGKKL